MVVGGELKDRGTVGTRESAWFVLVSEKLVGGVKYGGTDGTRETARFLLVSERCLVVD
jgi:hypothetical protein